MLKPHRNFCLALNALPYTYFSFNVELVFFLPDQKAIYLLRGKQVWIRRLQDDTVRARHQLKKRKTKKKGMIVDKATIRDASAHRNSEPRIPIGLFVCNKALARVSFRRDT